MGGRGRPVDRRRRAAQFGQQSVVDIDDDLHHAGHRPGGRPDHGAGEDGLAAAAGHGMDDHDRKVDDGVGGDVDDQRVGHEGIVEQHVSREDRRPPSRAGRRRPPARRPAQREQAVVGRRGHRGQHAVEGHHQARTRAQGVDQSPHPVRRRGPGGGRAGRSGADRAVPVEIELIDAAVPPDLVLLGGQDGRAEGLGGGRSSALQPGGPGKGTGGLRSEGGQVGNSLSRKEARLRASAPILPARSSATTRIRSRAWPTLEPWLAPPKPRRRPPTRPSPPSPPRF